MTKESFREIVEEWYNPLYRFAYSLCRNPDDALDRTQNAFQKLAQHADSLRDPRKVKSWLFSVLHREFVDDYRHEQRFPKTSLELVSDPSGSASQSAGDGLDTAKALNCLQQLAPHYRAPVSLFYLESFSYKEIAETLDIPIGTVMSRLRRAKDQLRVLIESKSSSSPKPNSVPFPKQARNG